MPGFPPVPHAWTEPTPSFPPESTAQPLPVSSANPCSLLLPRALFASKPWTPGGSPLLQELRRQNYEAQSLENLVFKLADTGLLAPDLEKLGIMRVTDKTCRRPGDISIK